MVKSRNIKIYILHKKTPVLVRVWTVTILKVADVEDQFIIKRDDVYLAWFKKYDYTLSSDGKSAIFQSTNPEGVLATVTAGDYYKIYVSGTDHDGEYLEIIDLSKWWRA